MIRLIASDIDGTLIKAYGSVNPEIHELIPEFRKRGVQFAAASGRQYTNLKRIFVPEQDEIDYICENGCLIFMRGKLICKETMPDSLGQDMIAAILETPGAEALVSGERTSYVQPKDPAFETTLRDVIGNDVTAVGNLLEKREDYFKISAFLQGGVTEQTMRYWQGLFGNDATVVYGGNGWIDMMPKGIHKGTGICRLMEAEGLKKEEVMAFGDNYNDEEMLNSVEYSYAMAEAPQEIRDFTYGTCSDVVQVLKETLRKMDRGEPL
jgi:Cof subfamily protein (haloacid dehalogenase superfamily)